MLSLGASRVPTCSHCKGKVAGEISCALPLVGRFTKTRQNLSFAASLYSDILLIDLTLRFWVNVFEKKNEICTRYTQHAIAVLKSGMSAERLRDELKRTDSRSKTCWCAFSTDGGSFALGVTTTAPRQHVHLSRPVDWDNWSRRVVENIRVEIRYLLRPDLRECVRTGAEGSNRGGIWD